MRTRERHKIYKQLLEDCKKNKAKIGLNFIYGFCYAFKRVLPDSYFLKSGSLRMADFPEILNNRPSRRVLDRRMDAFWFNRDTRGDNKRLAILLQAIKETQPKRKTR